MKYVKMLALAAVATGAMMAFIGAGSASASVICSTTKDPCPKTQDWPANTVLDFSLKSGTSAKLVNTAGETLDNCTSSTVKGKITTTGGGTGATETVTGSISELTWGGCTFTTTTITKACLEVHQIAGTSNGTVTADECNATHGSEPSTNVTINTVLFGSCIYTVTAGKSIGDISEGKDQASGAPVSTFTANAVATKVTGSNFACPETSKWTATYVLTEPKGTTLSVSSSVEK
jgi:hypothetical protein